MKLYDHQTGNVIPGKPNWVSIQEAQTILVLHEIVHYFIGPHGNGMMPETDLGVMNVDPMNYSSSYNPENHYLYSNGTHGVLGWAHIFSIQRMLDRNKPEVS